MLLDSQYHLNELKLPREARKRSPKKKYKKSLLKSFDKSTDCVDIKPRIQRRVTFLSSEESKGLLGKYSSQKRYETVAMETDRDIIGSPASTSTSDSPYFNEEPCIIMAIVRIINGNTTKCLPVKLSINIQQFQDLRTDPKRLKAFKKKLQPLILNLLPAEDRFKPWTVDSIEPRDNEMVSNESFTDCGVTKEKPVSRDKRVTSNDFNFEPFDSQSAVDFSATSSPYQVDTFYDSDKSLESEEKSISEEEHINYQPTEDFSWQHTFQHNPIDSSCKKTMDECGSTALPNCEFIKNESSEKMDGCSDQDLFALLYGVDCKTDIKTESFRVNKNNAETDQISTTSGMSNHLSNEEIVQMEVPTESPIKPVSQKGESRFDLAELLDNWDEESQFIKGAKSAEKLNEAVQFDSPGHCVPYEHNSSSYTSAEIVSTSSDENYQPSASKCPSPNFHSNSSLPQKENFQLESVLTDDKIDHAIWISNEAFEKEHHRQHPVDQKCTERNYNGEKKNYISPLMYVGFSHHQSQSLDKIKISSIFSKNLGGCKHLDEIEYSNSTMDEDEASGHRLSDFRNADVVISVQPVAMAQPEVRHSKLNEASSTSLNMPIQRLHSPILSSQVQNCLPSEQFESNCNYVSEPVIQSSSSPTRPSHSFSIPKDRTNSSKLEPVSQSYNSKVVVPPYVHCSTLPFEPVHQSRGSLFEISKQIDPSFQGESIENELDLQRHSFPSEINESLVISKKNSLAGYSFSNIDDKNTVSLPKQKPTPLSFSRKPTCSILISSRFKSLSKNKSLIATGRPVPKRKEIPFLMKGKLKKIKLS